jgi:hypothetical protein
MEHHDQSWGTFSIIQDSEGNHILLVEQPQVGADFDALA